MRIGASPPNSPLPGAWLSPIGPSISPSESTGCVRVEGMPPPFRGESEVTVAGYSRVSEVVRTPMPLEAGRVRLCRRPSRRVVKMSAYGRQASCLGRKLERKRGWLACRVIPDSSETNSNQGRPSGICGGQQAGSKSAMEVTRCRNPGKRSVFPRATKP